MISSCFLQKGVELASPRYVVYNFLRKTFLMLHSINRPNFIAWLRLLLEILGNICNYLLSSLWRHKFWNYPDLFYQAVFLHNQKDRTKMWISQERKKLLTWNKKWFSLFLKGFPLCKIKLFWLVTVRLWALNVSKIKRINYKSDVFNIQTRQKKFKKIGLLGVNFP